MSRYRGPCPIEGCSRERTAGAATCGRENHGYQWRLINLARKKAEDAGVSQAAPQAPVSAPASIAPAPFPVPSDEASAPSEIITPSQADIDRLRAQCDSLCRQLADQKRSKKELIDAVYRAASEASAGLHLPPVPRPVLRPHGNTPETAVLIVSDWQLGKKTPNYNSMVCERRIEELARKVVQLTRVQRADHPVDELRIYAIGDMLEGELIFPGQTWRIDASLFEQMCLSGPRILGNLVRTGLANFEHVSVETVPGNHGFIGGRSRKEMHPETNADAMLFEITKQLLGREPRLKWGENRIPGENKWHAIDTIGENNFFLTHGHAIHGYAGFPWYGLGKKAAGWNLLAAFVKAAGITKMARYMAIGHFHTPGKTYINGVTVWANGSTESGNTYAAEELASGGEPCQQLLFVHPRRGVTGEYLIHLGEEEEVAA